MPLLLARRNLPGAELQVIAVRFLLRFFAAGLRYEIEDADRRWVLCQRPCVSEALGSNLLGAVVGGVLESISFWTGLRALLLASVSLYVFSALTLKARHRVSGVSASSRSSENLNTE